MKKVEAGLEECKDHENVRRRYSSTRPLCVVPARVAHAQGVALGQISTLLADVRARLQRRLGMNFIDCEENSGMTGTLGTRWASML